MYYIFIYLLGSVMQLWISPSPMRVLRVQLRMSGSEADALTYRTVLLVQNRGPYFQYFLSMCYHYYKILDGGRSWLYSLLFSEQYKAFHFLSDGQNSLFQFLLF